MTSVDLFYVFYLPRSKYKEPVLDEGFTEMVRVNFRYDFTSPDTEALYKMYLLEDWNSLFWAI